MQLNVSGAVKWEGSEQSAQKGLGSERVQPVHIAPLALPVLRLEGL